MDSTELEIACHSLKDDGKNNEKKILLTFELQTLPRAKEHRKIHFGQGDTRVGDRMAHPRYFTAVPLDFPGLPAPFLARSCLELVLRPTGCSKRRGYPLSHGCLTRNPRTFQRVRWDSATASGRLRASTIYHNPARDPFCGLVCTSGFL